MSRSHGGFLDRLQADAFAAYLRQATARPIGVVLVRDYDRLLEGVTVGGIDLAWMPPVLHARAGLRGAFLTAVCERGGAALYRSALVVRAGFESWSAIRERRPHVAWVDPSSASGYLLPRLHMEQHGVLPAAELGSERFFGSATATIRALVEEEADVAACYVRHDALDERTVLAELSATHHVPTATLRLLSVTPPIAPDGFVVGAGVHDRELARIRDLLLDLHRRPAGVETLRSLTQADRLLPVTEEILLAIERLELLVRPSPPGDPELESSDPRSD